MFGTALNRDCYEDSCSLADLKVTKRAFTIVNFLYEDHICELVLGETCVPTRAGALIKIFNTIIYLLIG